MESSDCESSDLTGNESSDLTENEGLGMTEQVDIGKLGSNNMSSPNVIPKPNMTDQERKELAAKLDEDLDSFISGLEKRSYSEGWPEDRWQEEMEKHPFFMTKAPEPGEELSPLLQGLQNLKYGESDNTPEELALTYKEDGNFNFKCKKYRFAIVCYTEGLRQKCENLDLNAQLYNNRAASHYFLKNFRSCVNDCLSALRFKPDYTKTAVRAANCYMNLEEFDKCVEVCESILTKDPTNNEIISLKMKAITKKKIEDRDLRKQYFKEKKSKEEEKKLLDVIHERGIKLLGNDSEISSICQLEPTFPEVIKKPVHLQDGRLVWPVLFLYPEYQISDFVQEFHEDALFSEQFVEMFLEPPEWDQERKYTPDKISIYYEDADSKPHKVPNNSTLGNILSRENYRVDKGTPAFLLFSKNSKAEIDFLKL